MRNLDLVIRCAGLTRSLPRGRGVRVIVAVVAAVLVGGCATTSAPGPAPGDGAAGGGVLSVVATTNAWGSIAAQLGGTRVHETSIINNPDTDPHDYEPTPADARTIAGAALVVSNGVGYDPWADKLLAANPLSGRRVLNVGELVGVPAGGNPHRWYAPADVRRVADELTSDLQAADPADASYFDTQKQRFLTQGLARYTQLIDDIKARYAGTPVGASESIFSPLAEALGLNVITPPGFLTAISEGAEVSAADKAVIDQQIATKAIKVYVVNSQNSTPDIAAQVEECKKRGIPVTEITETLSPATATFQDWQVGQLMSLQAALRQASGT
ncbi:MAG TPA: zinc ABC transporter substrate-binding protein [Pseudonocardiaceae bacterium]|nr:zinc ABC transporter substrate-binding protein [Pseudonocardiaceae bacterium]